MFQRLTILAACIAVVPATAHAYIGPGMGLGAIAMLFGVVAAFFMVMLALLWFPLKRMLRRRRTAQAVAPDE